MDSDFIHFYDLPLYTLGALYALKQAGDWAQVEHARKFGKVFVTFDKMAAMYARYRRVPFILVRRLAYDDFLRYTFVLHS